MLTRISGVMFDLMVVASIAAIDLSAFRERNFILPLAVICVQGAIISYFDIKFVCDRLFSK
jgi:Na+/glutamate symporter